MANKKSPRAPPPLPTPAQLDLFWRGLRGGPNFIGPVGPPMWLWMHDREKQKAWRQQCNLGEIDDGEEAAR